MNARKLPEPSGLRGWFDMGICVVYGLFVAIFVTVFALDAGALTPVILLLSPIVISLVSMALVRIWAEPAACDVWFKPGGMFSPKTQSWAFLFGDGVGLPVALGAAGMSSSLDWVSGHREPWLVVSAIVGIAASITFRFMDVKAYTKLGHEDRLRTPTKLWHDGVVYSSLVTLLVYFGVPAVWHDFSGYGWIVALGFIFWLVMCVADMFRKPDPVNMHPRKQDTKIG